MREIWLPFVSPNFTLLGLYLEILDTNTPKIAKFVHLFAQFGRLPYPILVILEAFYAPIPLAELFTICCVTEHK